MSQPGGVSVVGCGRWGRNLVRIFASLGSLRSVVDIDPAAAKAMAEAYDVPAVELDAALADPDVDGFVVAVPPKDHVPVGRQALQAGKHLLVEKPLALSVNEAEGLCALAEQRERILMVGHLMRYHPAFIELERLVTQGVLGQLRYISSNRLNLGRVRRDEDVLWSFGPHDVSMVLALVGTDPLSVSAVAGEYLRPGVPDVSTVHLTFSQGRRASVFVSWLHPIKEHRLVVVGDEAMAVFDDGQPWTSKLCLFRHAFESEDGVIEAVPGDREPVKVRPAEPLETECRQFLECIAGATSPPTDGRESVRVLRVLESARQSIAEDSRRSNGQQAMKGHPFVHESAYVDEPAEIGEGTRIWHFSHVMAGARIGRDCNVGQNVMIGPGVTVGDGCKIQNNVSVYRGVTLEDGVFCGPSAVFTNVLNPRAEIDRSAEIRATRVGRGATIGANATVLCGNDIGRWAFVAAGAVVTADVPAHALVVGVPARQVGWVGHAGERLGPDLICPRTARRYRLDDAGRLDEVDANG